MTTRKNEVDGAAGSRRKLVAILPESSLATAVNRNMWCPVDRYYGYCLCLVGFLAAWFASPVLAGERVALFDQGHGQRFLIEGDEPLGLSTLAETFKDQGLTLRVKSRAMNQESLREVTALVLSGPFQPVSKTETAAIEDFLGRGGRLCIMLHIAEPVRSLLSTWGVTVTRTPIREGINLLGDDPMEFRVKNLVAHPVTSGLKSFNVKGCWGLRNMNDSVQILAWSSPRTWCDLNGDGRRGAEEFSMPQGIIAAGERGKGAFLVFGDDAIFQNRFLSGGNLKLARNLAAWLKEGRVP